MKTNHPFAILLVFFHRYHRNKINKNGLEKVLRKYLKKSIGKLISPIISSKLLTDLYGKYSKTYYEHLEEVTYSEVYYIVRKYYNQIPIDYLRILQDDYDSLLSQHAISSNASWQFTRAPVYDEKYDIFQTEFTPEKAISEELITSLDVGSFPALDNLSKVFNLLPERRMKAAYSIDGSPYRMIEIKEEDQTPELILEELLRHGRRRAETCEMEIAEKLSSSDGVETEKDTTLAESLRAVYTKRQEDVAQEVSRRKEIEKQQIEKSIIESIAKKSIPKYISTNSLGEKIEISSPLALIYEFWKRKVRVRIITRHRTSLRGSIDAYIFGFDRFMNLLLKDCDEEYVPTIRQGKRKKTIRLGKFTHSEGVLNRFLPHVILRGDNIVMIFQKPNMGNNTQK